MPNSNPAEVERAITTRSNLEPLTSWGVLIAEGAAQMESAPWLLLFPASMLASTLFCFNFIGDGLRDALDPRDR